MLSFQVYLPETLFSTTGDKQIPGAPVYTWGGIYTSGKSCGMYKQSDDKSVCANALVQVEFVWRGNTTKRKRKIKTHIGHIL